MTSCEIQQQPSIPSRARLKEAVQELCAASSQRLVDDSRYASLLRKCIEFKALAEGRELHSQIARGEFRRSSYLNNLLTQMYGKCCCLDDARRVFDSLGDAKNVYSWNIMITAYSQNGHLQEAKSVFDNCPRRTLVSWNAMVTAYSQNGRLTEAKILFDSMDHRDIVTWNAMLAAYAQNGHEPKATEMFKAMVVEGVAPNSVSFITVFDACGRVSDLRLAHALYDEAAAAGLTDDFKLATAIVSAYGKCGSLEDAKRVFDGLPERSLGISSRNALLSAYVHNHDLAGAKSVFDRLMPARDHISWNIMMVALGRSGLSAEALDCFRNMDLDGVPPDTATFANVLDSCTNLRDGRAIHSCVVGTGHASHLMVATAIVDMYGKCGSVEEARAVFEGITDKDVVAWNAMVAAYAHNGQGGRALGILGAMDLEGMAANESTFVSAIDGCSSITAAAQGKLLHSLIVDSGFQLQGKVVNALVTMYGRCGDLARARGMFDRFPTPDSVLWNAMIGAYAQWGRADEALEVFYEMFGCGVFPTTVTFSSVLVACSRVGLLAEAGECFRTMLGDCHLASNSEHFHCLVDVLCRAGKLREAHELLLCMPYEADFPAWSALISACGVHGDSKIGREVADEVISMAGKDSGLYVILSQVFSSAGMDNELAKLEGKRRFG